MADTTNIDDYLWGDYKVGNETSKKIEGVERKNDLDKNAFLNLLITQMKYQDPMNPTEDKEFIAQMAQFSALEQMQNLNQATAYSQGFSLIGKDVVGKAYNEATNKYLDVAGRVDSVLKKNGVTYLTIGDVELELSGVTHVFEDSVATATMQSINKNLFDAQTLALVGKNIQAITFDKNQKPTGYVEGVVNHIKFQDGMAILSVGNKEIYPQEVISVSKDAMLIGKKINATALNSTTKEYESVVDGTIEGINIYGDKVYVVVDGKEAQFDKIDKLTNAITAIGQEATSTTANGMIHKIVVRNSKIYALVGENQTEVLFDDLKLKG